MMTNDAHIPVLYEESLEALHLNPNGIYIDGTLGLGGHSEGILQRTAPNGRLIAFDKDPNAIQQAQARLAPFGERLTIVHDSYANMERHLLALGISQVDGILLDLGVSSLQLDTDNRGFSFRREGPLDMRFDPTHGETAADLVNNLAEAELADIIWRYGEEHKSRFIARLIVEHRPFTTTTQLADLIAQKIRGKRGRHPATQLFQALRIAVNRELETVENGVEVAVKMLKPNGRLAVISFHSLEDRFVKQYMRQISQTCVCPPTQPICNCETQPLVKLTPRKAIKPNDQEIAHNPRSRSARLRVAEKIAGGDS